MFIDTHVHLNNPQLEANFEQVINDALMVGVEKMIVVGYDLETSKKAVELANQYDFIYAAVGFHPTEIKNYTDDEYQNLELLASMPKVVAIGEVGFDFHWDTTTKEEQLTAFVRQIELAKKLKLPLIIHSRDAHQLTFETLKKHNASKVGGIMHSYSGSVEMAKEYLKMHFCLGISGPVTFKNGKNMKDVVKAIDAKYLVSETDSPYLTPEPYRGQINGPKNVLLIVEEMAKLKGISISEMAQNIKDNVKRIFGDKYE